MLRRNDMPKKAYLDTRRPAHCLSRCFSDGPGWDKVSRLISPQSVSEVLEEDRYDKFSIGSERKAHNAIPNVVGGSFVHFVAPYDPIFYLHRAQLDQPY